MKNKIFLSLFAITVCITSCKSVQQIGKVNMLSTRNINTETKYELLSSYTGGTINQLKKSKAENIETAITNTVKNVPGGEFLMNVKIYQVNSRYFAVEGDVWGIKGTANYSGFQVGEVIKYKQMGEYKNGKIISFKNSDTAIIEKEDGKTGEIPIDKIFKSK